MSPDVRTADISQTVLTAKRRHFVREGSMSRTESFDSRDPMDRTCNVLIMLPLPSTRIHLPIGRQFRLLHGRPFFMVFPNSVWSLRTNHHPTHWAIRDCPYAEQSEHCEEQNCEYLANCFHGDKSIRFPINDAPNGFAQITTTTKYVYAELIEPQTCWSTHSRPSSSARFRPMSALLLLYSLAMVTTLNMFLSISTVSAVYLSEVFRSAWVLPLNPIQAQEGYRAEPANPSSSISVQGMSFASHLRVRKE